MKKYFSLLFIASFLAFASICNAQSGIITTIAGTGTVGDTGDGGPATAAQISGVFSCIDAMGNIYINDVHSIRKINSLGVITRFAGTGADGICGDGVPATATQIHYPMSMGADASGNLYFADLPYARKIDASGIVVTYAGTGFLYFNGDGIPATSADLEVAYLAVDPAGNVYISDYDNSRIRKINTAGIITTIAGTGTSGYTGDGGLATAAEVEAPRTIATDAMGNVYFFEAELYTIRKIDALGIITTIAGNGVIGYSGDGGPATVASLSGVVQGIAVDGTGQIYISDYNNNAVREINTSGIINTIAGNGTCGYTGDGGPATAAELCHPGGISVDAMGNIYFGDHGITCDCSSYVRKISRSTLGVSTQGTPPVNVYPNPAKDEFTITGLTESTRYRLLNVTGASLRQGTLQQGNNTVLIRDISSGIYIFETTGASGQRSYVRVVKG